MERDEGIYMSKQGQFFYSTVSDFLNNKLCRKDAAELLEVTERSVTRMARRVEEKGLFAGVHGNRGKIPWNKKDGGMKKSVMS